MADRDIEWLRVELGMPHDPELGDKTVHVAGGPHASGFKNILHDIQASIDAERSRGSGRVQSTRTILYVPFESEPAGGSVAEGDSTPREEPARHLWGKGAFLVDVGSLVPVDAVKDYAFTLIDHYIDEASGRSTRGAPAPVSPGDERVGGTVGLDLESPRKRREAARAERVAALAASGDARASTQSARDRLKALGEPRR